MRFSFFVLACGLAPSLFAQHEHCDHGPGSPTHPAADSESPHHPDLKLPSHPEHWFHFHPHLSAAVAIGGSTSEKNLGLIRGGHAPIDDGFNLQGVELGALTEFGPAVSIHTTYNVFWDRYDHWDGEWEEAFAAFTLPGDVTLRAGQFFAPFGHENSLHLHDRDFVEPPISLIRLLGEEGLVVQGGDLGLQLPGLGERTILRFGYGQSRSHTHGGARDFRRDLYQEALEHSGESEEEHDAHEEDEDHEDHEEHAHGFAGNGGVYDVDDAYLDDGFFFLRLESELRSGPGLNHAGVSLAAGENGFGRTTWVLGADLFGSFTLAQRPAWWRSEVFYRYVDAYDRAGNPGHFDEAGIYAAVGCEIIDHWTAAARLEWASGNRMAGAERRWRCSANIGHVAHLASNADLHTRLQYSFDDLGGYGTEHSIWLQWVFNFGAGCDSHSH